MTMNYNYEAIPGMADALRQIQEKHGKDHKKSSAKPKRWWDDDGDGVGYEPHEVKSSKKEGYDVDTANQLWDEVGERLEKLGEMDGAKFKVIGEKNGLYANIHAKRARGEAPAKPGDKDYPAKDAFKKAAKTAKEQIEYADAEELEQIAEISADLALRASKAADVQRGKKAAAGDKEGAAAKAGQASRLYKAQADRRLGRVTPGKANEELDLGEDVELDENRAAMRDPEGYESAQKKTQSSRERRMNDPHKGINSPAFAAFMAQQMGGKKQQKQQKEEVVNEKMDGVDDNGSTKCWKGYKKVGTKMKGGKEVNDCKPANEELQEIENSLFESGLFTEEEIHYIIGEKWEELDEATAMAKRGHDETAIRNKIASSTGGGGAADRATALASKQTYGQKGKGAPDPKARQKLAATQRGDFRKTASSSPGLHGYGHKSDDPAVKAKQAARGAQRGALTPQEKKDLGR